MSKWVEVKIEAVHFYLVEIEDNQTEDDAERVAMDEYIEDFDEITSEPVVEKDLDLYKRNTDRDKILGIS